VLTLAPPAVTGAPRLVSKLGTFSLLPKAGPTLAAEKWASAQSQRALCSLLSGEPTAPASSSIVNKYLLR